MALTTSEILTPPGDVELTTIRVRVVQDKFGDFQCSLAAGNGQMGPDHTSRTQEGAMGYALLELAETLIKKHLERRRQEIELLSEM